MQQGTGNLSPYSYFGVMSHDPPYVTIGTCATSPTSGRPNGLKDSQQNILETGWAWFGTVCLMHPCRLGCMLNRVEPGRTRL